MINFIIIMLLLIAMLIVLQQILNIQEIRDMIISRINHYNLNQDLNFLEELNLTIKNIVGKDRHNKYCNIDSIYKLIEYSTPESGNPAIRITIPYRDDTEKQVLKTLLSNLTREYLSNYGLQNLEVLSFWKEATDIGYPQLVILYSRNRQESDFLKQRKENKIKKTISSTTDVVDDSEALS